MVNLGYHMHFFNLTVTCISMSYLLSRPIHVKRNVVVNDMYVSFRNYIRPVHNQSASSQVQLDFYLYQLLAVDDVQQLVSVQALVSISW